MREIDTDREPGAGGETGEEDAVSAADLENALGRLDREGACHEFHLGLQRALIELDLPALEKRCRAGAAELHAGEDAVCLGVHTSPKPPPERITLSLAVLRAARSCVLLATGPSKADAVSAMLAEPTEHVPASLLRRERLTVIVDDAAAPPAPLR